MVAAALRSVFEQQSKEAVLERSHQISALLAGKFPRAAELLAKASKNVLAIHHIRAQHKNKVWRTNLLERFNEEIQRRTRVVGIFPKDVAIERVVGAMLLEQEER
jgi:putative transposase